MKKKKKRKILHQLFVASIAIKGIDGILELIGGSILLLTSSTFIGRLIHNIFQHELSEDPTDIIANYLIRATQHLPRTVLSFAALYLLIHGIIKIALIAGLWRQKLWAYPLAGIGLMLFSSYQFSKFLINHSPILLFLTFIDVLIIILLKFEYQRIKKERKSFSLPNLPDCL